MTALIFTLFSAGLLFIYGMLYTFTQTAKLVNGEAAKRNWKRYGMKLGILGLVSLLLATWLMVLHV